MSNDLEQQPRAAVPADWVDKVMSQAQVFASAWSLVGGPFDSGDMRQDAEDARDDLRAMLEAAPPPPAVPAVDVLRDLLFSLVWVGHSAHHHQEALRLLEALGGHADWEKELADFVRIRDKEPGRGDPRWIPGAVPAGGVVPPALLDAIKLLATNHPSTLHDLYCDGRPVGREVVDGMRALLSSQGRLEQADLPAPTLENAPLGTKAPAYDGGYWIRVERGWKWCTGATFPRPGGDWNGKLIVPAQPQSEVGHE